MRGDRVLALIITTCVCVGRGDRVLALINTTCMCVVKEDQVGRGFNVYTH